MDRGAKIGLRARHHPAVGHNHVKGGEIRLTALPKLLGPRRSAHAADLGDQRSAARASSGISSLVKAAELRGQAVVAEQVLKNLMGAKRTKPSRRNGETGQREGGQLDQMASFHFLPLPQAVGSRPKIRRPFS